MRLAVSRKNLWNLLGAPGRRVVGAAASLVPLEIVLGARYRANHRVVLESDRWSADEAHDWQSRMLREICQLAGRTPYYSRTWAALGIGPGDITRLEDLPRLPTIDRHTLNSHLDDMCVPGAVDRSADYVSTGGTSGTPLRFYIGAGRSNVEFAHVVAGWERAGYRLGMPLAVFRGRVVPPDRDGLRHEYDPLLRHHYYSNFHMSDENMGRYLEHVRGIGECFLHVYPSSIAALARFVRRSGLVPPTNVRGILAESEIVYPDQRKLVEETFGVRYFSSYGLTEKVVAAAECERSSAYHVFPTYGICELLDREGRPVTTPGAIGEITGTGFMNRIVPFLRYRTGDFATYVSHGCGSCGRQQLVLGTIEGHRVQEHLIMRDGTAVSWTAVNVHDDTFESVRRFQFQQTRRGAATLRIVAASTFGEGDRRRILERLTERLAGQLDITIELVEDIPLSKAGKSIYVDQQLREAERVSG